MEIWTVGGKSKDILLDYFKKQVRYSYISKGVSFFSFVG